SVALFTIRGLKVPAILKGALPISAFREKLDRAAASNEKLWTRTSKEFMASVLAGRTGRSTNPATPRMNGTGPCESGEGGLVRVRAVSLAAGVAWGAGALSGAAPWRIIRFRLDERSSATSIAKRGSIQRTDSMEVPGG